MFLLEKKNQSIEILLRENANQMFSKFKSVSLEGDLIKKTAEDFIMINSLNIQNINDEHENDMDLFTIDKLY